MPWIFENCGFHRRQGNSNLYWAQETQTYTYIYNNIYRHTQAHTNQLIIPSIFNERNACSIYKLAGTAEQLKYTVVIWWCQWVDAMDIIINIANSIVTVYPYNDVILLLLLLYVKRVIIIIISIATIYTTIGSGFKDNGNIIDD